MGDMGTVRVERYSPDKRDAWDEFVGSSKNGTFLFRRGYMDYHGDRFTDDSLFVLCGSRVVALLPGHSLGLIYASHDGLTYGGFVTDERMTTPLMVEVFEAVLGYLREQGYESLRYKCIPYIYHVTPASEDLYCLHLARAHLVRRNVLSVVGDENPRFQTRRRRGAARAEKHGLFVRPSDDFKTYWYILSELLRERHDTKPVHSLKEIELLAARFPLNIKLYTVIENCYMVAGTVIYETRKVARSQYIASNEKGRELGALDLLYDVLIHDVYQYKPFLDLGSSNEGWSWELNQGLIEYKESLGARNVNQDTYEVNITAWQPGMLRRALI